MSQQKGRHLPVTPFCIATNFAFPQLFVFMICPSTKPPVKAVSNGQCAARVKTKSAVTYFPSRRRKAAPRPVNPEPSNSNVAGSGIALPVTVPWIVVVPVPAPPPTPVTGSAIVYTGLTVYVKPAMFTDVDAKVSVAIPVLNPSVPDSDPTRLAAPAGETWMKFNVKVPPIAGPSRLAGTVVVITISPKLVPAGVLTGFVVPLNVIVVVPLMLVKLTTFVPLTLNTPVVENVTGSALATPWLNAKTATATILSATGLISVEILIIRFSLCPSTLLSF